MSLFLFETGPPRPKTNTMQQAAQKKIDEMDQAQRQHGNCKYKFT